MVAVNLRAAFLSPPVAMSAFYLERCGAETCYAESNLRRHDALHDHRLHLPRVHVRLAGHDALVAGIFVLGIDLQVGAIHESPLRFAIETMGLTDLHLLSATERRGLIRDGIISSEQLVELAWRVSVTSIRAG